MEDKLNRDWVVWLEPDKKFNVAGRVLGGRDVATLIAGLR